MTTIDKAPISGILVSATPPASIFAVATIIASYDIIISLLMLCACVYLCNKLQKLIPDVGSLLLDEFEAIVFRLQNKLDRLLQPR